MGTILYIVLSALALIAFLVVLRQRSHTKMVRYYSAQRAERLLHIAKDFNNMMG